MATLELTKAEQIALALLRSTPSEIQKLNRSDGTINLDDLHSYFHALVRALDLAQVRRRNEYIDVDKKEISDAVEHYAQTQSS